MVEIMTVLILVYLEPRELNVRDVEVIVIEVRLYVPFAISQKLLLSLETCTRC